MSDIIGMIGKNPLVKNILFNQLKKVFHEGNTDFIVVRLDQQGEIAVDLYEKGEAAITMLKGRDLSDFDPSLNGTPPLKSIKKGGKK